MKCTEEYYLYYWHNVHSIISLFNGNGGQSAMQLEQGLVILNKARTNKHTHTHNLPSYLYMELTFVYGNSTRNNHTQIH